MRRLILAICLAAPGAPPLAAAPAGMDCALSGRIVAALVEARMQGAGEDRAAAAVAAALDPSQARYRPAVAPLAQWVYSMPPAQMGDAVPAAWVTACEAQ